MNIHAIEEIEETGTERSVLAIRFGRGRTGGTTFLDFLVQRTRRAGRAVVIADGDPNNATLADLYPPGEPGGAIRPRGSDIGDVMDWVTDVVSQMAADRSSMVLDMGAGDKVLEEHAKEMSLRAFCENAGVRTLAVYSLGPTIDDFNHVMTIHEKGFFRAERSLFVLNESLVAAGKSAGGAFDFVIDDPRFKQIEGDVRAVMMPRLACMDVMRRERLTFQEAAEGQRGRSGRPMSLGHQFMVKTWINRMEENLSDLGAWLP
jgi:hypothetical protein